MRLPLESWAPGSPRERPRIFLDLGERANPRSDGVGAVWCGVGDGRCMDVLVLVRGEAVLERWVLVDEDLGIWES